MAPYNEVKKLGISHSLTYKLRTVLFWALTQGVVVINRRFGANYRSHLQGSRNFLDSWPLKMGPDRLSRNIGKELPARCVINQRGTVLVVFAAEVKLHKFFLLLLCHCCNLSKKKDSSKRCTLFDDLLRQQMSGLYIKWHCCRSLLIYLTC